VAFTSDEVVTVTFGEDDLGPLDVREVDELLATPQKTELLLEIVSPTFKKGNKWRFSDGANTFWAIIEDKAFTQRVQRRQEAFRQGDTCAAKSAENSRRKKASRCTPGTTSSTWETIYPVRRRHSTAGKIKTQVSRRPDARNNGRFRPRF
jgi:hypothetical protein